MADPNIPNLEPRVAVLEQIASDLVNELRTLRKEVREDLRDLRKHDDFRLLIGRQDRQFYIVLTVMLAGFAGMLGTMAHGFKWI